jgi:hypothetical protein
MHSIARLVTPFALLALTSCVTEGYGSRFHPVALTTIPPQCQGWIIPNTRWISQKEKILQEGVVALEASESIRTPWTGRLPPYVHVFVAVDAEQRLLWDEFTPSRDTEVVIDFGQAPPPPPPVEE